MKKQPIWSFFRSNAEAVQAVCALVMVVLTFGALIGINSQIDAARKLAQVQSARDIYREFLALSINQPRFASPNYCEIIEAGDETAYENYVDYLFYTAEQGIEADENWIPIFSEAIGNHMNYICAAGEIPNIDPHTQTIVSTLKQNECKKIIPCPQ